jgi:hypothetical protein
MVAIKICAPCSGGYFHKFIVPIHAIDPVVGIIAIEAVVPLAI